MPRKRQKNLTPKQKIVLKFILDYILKNGVAPTYREILSFLGANSIGTVQRYIRTLEDKGFIERIPGKHRYMEIKKPPIILEGEVSAGIGTKEEIHTPLDVIGIIKELSPDFALKVKGYSMTAAGIKPGDYIFAKELTSPPHNGKIVIAYNKKENSYLIKRYRIINNKPFLISESLEEDYPPIPVDNEIQIIAEVVGLFRRHV